MGNVSVLPTASDYSPAQLALIRRTVAADTNDNEFNLFVMAARSAGLNPFAKQISALVFNKNSADKRRMVTVVTIDGLRVIAARTGRYRPDGDAPTYVTDPELKSPTNPHGIVSCGVKVFTRDQDGVWFPCHGEAYWEEFAPLTDEWAEDPQTGKRRPSGKKTLGDTWARMPRLMIAKCAEAQALRRAFPNDFAQLYSDAELDRAKVEDMAPAEAVEAFAREIRQAQIGGPGALFQWMPNTPLEHVPFGQIADRVAAFLAQCADLRQLTTFESINRHSMNEFWAHSKGDALEVKKMLAARKAELEAA